MPFPSFTAHYGSVLLSLNAVLWARGLVSSAGKLPRRSSCLLLLLTARLARRALPWCGLFCLSLAAAQVVQVAAASLPAPVNTPLVITTDTVMPADAVASSASSPSVLVMITVQDATTGNESDILCRTTRDRTSSDALLMGSAAARMFCPCFVNRPVRPPMSSTTARASYRPKDVSVLDPYFSC
jgi:hypothetical protein